MFLHFLYVFFIILIRSSAVRSADLRPDINITKHLFFPNFSPRFPQDITFLGNAGNSPEDDCIQIPNEALKLSAGRAIHSSPIRLLDPATGDPASFSTTFSFRISGMPATGGLSFIFVPDELTVGRPGPWLAMMNDACDDESKVFAVEIDTRMNSEFHDPNDNHIGINLGSVVSSLAINASDFGFRLDDGEIHRLWISYDGERKFLEIYLGSDTNLPPSKPGYAGKLDLSPYLNEYMFVGFSGSTGEHYTRSHTVCSWNFTAVSRALLRLPPSESCLSKVSLEDPEEAHSEHKTTPIIFYVVLSLFLLAMAVLVGFFFIRRHKKNKNSEEDDAHKNPSPPTRPRNFSLAAVSATTGGFAEIQILGSDSNSVSYKGYLSNDVVVKRYSRSFCDSAKRKTMINEIKQIGKIRHPNLVAIRGWCFQESETIIIYDFVPNGTLDKWMAGDRNLTWNRRLRIIKDVADALRYLHSRVLAHKNVKSSSVFLDMSFRSVLGDFGFGFIDSHSVKVESCIRQQIDVFEFGVLVLEIVSGAGMGSGELLDAAWRMHEGNEKDKFVDRRMGAMVMVDQPVRVMEIGLLCTLNENKGRPSMDAVVEYLNDDRKLPELPDRRPVCLFPYNSNTGLVCGRYTCRPFK